MSYPKELYTSLYTKYAPELSEDELRDKIDYARTLNDNDFINSFYEKYTGGKPTEEQLSYINTFTEDSIVKPNKKIASNDNNSLSVDPSPIIGLVKGKRFNKDTNTYEFGNGGNILSQDEEEVKDIFSELFAGTGLEFKQTNALNDRTISNDSNEVRGWNVIEVGIGGKSILIETNTTDEADWTRDLDKLENILMAKSYNQLEENKQGVLS